MIASKYPFFWEVPDFWLKSAGASVVFLLAIANAIWLLTVTSEYLERGSEPLQVWELSGDRILVRCSSKREIWRIQAGLKNRFNGFPWMRYEAVYAASGLKLANARTVPAIIEKLTGLGAVRVPHS